MGLGLEEPAGSSERADGEPDTAPEGDRYTGTLRDALVETERRICGPGARSSPSAAEGFALAGRRAATLPGSDSLEPAAALAGRTAAWVHHRILDSASPVLEGAFELVASSAQEAVDHCLVGHHLSALFERPGVCSIASSLLQELHVVRIPTPEMIAAMLDRAPVGGNSGVAADPAAAVGQAFRVASRVLGRELAPAELAPTGPAERVVVVAGRATVARRLVERARAAGRSVALLRVSCPRPAASASVMPLLGRASRVLVVEDAAISRHGLIDAAPGKGAPEIVGIPGVAAERILAEELQVRAAPEPDEESRGLALWGARPTDRAERLLLDVAGRLVSAARTTMARDLTPDGEVLRVGGAGRAADGSLDLLLLLGPEAPRGALDRLRDDGVLLVHAAGTSPERFWAALDPRSRARLVEGGPALAWLDSAELPAQEWYPAVCGAVLASIVDRSPLADREADVWESLRRTGLAADELRNWQSGARAMRRLEPERLEAATRAARETLPIARPRRMPARLAEDAERAETLRRFHLGGGDTEPHPPFELEPVALAPLVAEARPRDLYPLLLPGESEEGAADGRPSLRSFRDVVTEALQGLADDGEPAPMLTRQASHLSRTVERLLERGHGSGALGELLDAALRELVQGIEVSSAGASALDGEIERLRGRLGGHGSLMALGPHTALRLLVSRLAASRSVAVRNLVAEMRSLIDRLAARAGSDGRHGDASPGTIAASLGAVGSDLVDAASLAGNLQTREGPRALDETRRMRIEGILSELRRGLESLESDPAVVVLHAPGVPAGLPEDVREVEHAEPLAAAVGLFDGLAERATSWMRALRAARLEIDGEYDPAIHDALLAGFDWQAATSDELHGLSRVLACETAERLRGRSLAFHSALLRSGRPVQVLVRQNASPLRDTDRHDMLTGYDPGLGYLSVAHREAFVLQSSLAVPQHLAAGLQRQAETLGPAVALVAEPSWDASVPPWLQLVAAHEGRGAPCFVYDPGRGLTWAERFDLGGNPQPERVWPQLEWSYVDDEGSERSRAESFTLAHAEALDPTCRGHFRVIPPQAWSDRQVEIAEWLDLPEGERLRHVPYLWVDAHDATLVRAVMTRELAFACRDRARAWRILQELGGTANEHARLAAAVARAEARDEASREHAELETRHAAELEQLRESAASEAFERLARGLVDLGPGAFDAGGGFAALPPPPAGGARELPLLPQPTEEPPAAAAVSPSVAEAEPDDDDDVAEDPWVDSVLCTTCNECTQINPRLFRYNGDRQAEIADPAAGTFEEIVRAAEKCPARCIHPGAPRPGDSTAVDEVVARARPFR